MALGWQRKCVLFKTLFKPWTELLDFINTSKMVRHYKTKCQTQRPYLEPSVQASAAASAHAAKHHRGHMPPYLSDPSAGNDQKAICI